LDFAGLSAGSTYPDKSVPDINAFYRAVDNAAALIVESSKQGCIALSVTNYDKNRQGFARTSRPP
jgi:hypothetical protein